MAPALLDGFMHVKAKAAIAAFEPCDEAAGVVRVLILRLTAEKANGLCFAEGIFSGGMNQIDDIHGVRINFDHCNVGQTGDNILFGPWD